MIDITQIVAVVVAVITTIGMYMFKKFVDSEEMKRDLSSIMYSEIEFNKKLLIVNMQHDKLRYVIKFFRTNVYDGIVSSTNIRYFTDDLQDAIHDLYHDVKFNNDDCFKKLAPVNINLIAMRESHPQLRTRIKKLLYNKLFPRKHSKKYAN